MKERPDSGLETMIWQKYSKVSKANSYTPSDSVAIQTKILIRLPTQLPSYAYSLYLQLHSCGSYCKNNLREPATFLYIAQRLALEGKQSRGDGATREDFLRLLENLRDTTHPIYLAALQSCEKHPQ
ncbi:hypothetical protein QYF36_024712 [Acer negundo]|nr:hypothetical protein QYF36_024712 [Acer negundo]